jgi:hypothetical protein
MLWSTSATADGYPNQSGSSYPGAFYARRLTQGGIVKSKETCGRRVGKCILAGLVGGLIGTILMMEFQNAWSAASQNVKEVDRGQQSGSDQNEQSQQEKESTTMKVPESWGKSPAIHSRMSKKKKLGPVVHYLLRDASGCRVWSKHGSSWQLWRNARRSSLRSCAVCAGGRSRRSGTWTLIEAIGTSSSLASAWICCSSGLWNQLWDSAARSARCLISIWDGGFHCFDRLGVECDLSYRVV